MEGLAKFARASLKCGKVSINWGSTAPVMELKPFWLRLHDPSSSTKNQQRLFEMSKVIDGTLSSEVTNLTSGSDGVCINWSDGAKSYYDWNWLAKQAKPKEVHQHFWDGSFQQKLPWMEYDAFSTSSGKLQLCTYLQRYGLAFLRGLGAGEGTIRKVGNEIGHIRVTNYGDIFDVKDEGVNATNLAFTNQRISAHTDNPYRDPFPGIQMLHCLSCAEAGGATLFTDGFRVAEELKTLDGDAFRLLSGISHPFEYRDPDAAVLLQASVPVIKLQNGNIQRITFNNRSAAPLSPELPELEAYYRAWALFDRLANSGAFTVRIELKPGDLAIWSNGRVMHGREAYERGAPRHLQGAYLDGDEINSTVAAALADGEDLEKFFCDFSEVEALSLTGKNA